MRTVSASIHDVAGARAVAGRAPATWPLVAVFSAFALIAAITVAAPIHLF